MKKAMNNKGFSLVELIIVVAIMAILVGVLAPVYTSYVEKSRKSSDVSAFADASTAIETVMIEYSSRGINCGDIAVSIQDSGTTVSASGTAKSDVEVILGCSGTDGYKMASKAYSAGGSITGTINASGNVTFTAGGVVSTMITDYASLKNKLKL